MAVMKHALLGLLLALVATAVCAGELASSSKVTLSIEVQPMADALNQWAQKTGYQVIFPEESATADIVSPRLSGKFTAREALNRLLSGTNLVYEFLNDRTVAVRLKSDRTTFPRPVADSYDSSTMPLRLVQTDNPQSPDSGTAKGQSTEDRNSTSTTSSAQSNDGQPRLAEIIVTAQKRAENLQEVPISAQVVDGQTLAQQNYNSLEELTETVPDVHVQSGNFSNTLSIRGIGSGSSQSFDQSVAMFVDDIYHGRSRMSDATFLDLDRIEVLKGPQSTFFGNNAIAGALNIVTKRPSDHLEAWARGLYGMFGQYAAEGAIGGPISDTLGVRLAVTRNGDDRGWIENVNTGEHVPRINNVAGRLTFVFNPVENLDATMKTEAGLHQAAGAAFDQPLQWANCPPPAPLTPTSLGSRCGQALALGVPIGIDSNETTGLSGQGNRLSTFEDALTINYHEWGHTFTSVSGFYNYHFAENLDYALLPAWLFTVQFPEKYHQFSQEFRVVSPADQAFEYMAGVYYQTDGLTHNQETNVPYLNFLGSVPPFTALAPYLPLGVADSFSQREQVYSTFGSLRWHLTDHLRLNAGLRGSWVKKDFQGSLFYGTATQQYGGFVPMPAALQSLAALLNNPAGEGQYSTRSDHAWMPSVGLQYDLATDAMVYVTYSRGFKAGGFNGEQPTLPPASIVFGPEHVNAYELGIKSKWFEDRLLVNADVFRSDYQDLQVNANVLSGPPLNTVYLAVRNAASSRSQGVELETQWVVSKDFRLSANVTYLDAYYLSYPNSPPTDLQNFCAASYVTPYCSRFPNPVPSVANFAGHPTDFAPKWSGSLNVSYSIALPSEYKLTTVLSPYFTSRYNIDPDGLFPSLGNYARLDGRLTLESASGHWSLDLVGKNLTDRIIEHIALTSIQESLVSKEAPRSFALQLRCNL